MRIRWRNFELPSSVILEKETKSEEYGRFSVEPFERGFGHTIGNGLRRVLLSSIEGTAITAVKIGGVSHEFDSLDGVFEDATDIILNLKRLRVSYSGDKPITCMINANKKGEVTGADVECEGDAEVVNKDLHIATLTMDRNFEIELDVRRGRGYVSADENAIEIEGITFINYRGTDDESKIAIGTDKVRFFPVGKGFFKAGFAPANEFKPYLNQRAREYYGLILADTSGRDAWDRVELYSYPLMICTRPGTLLSGKKA